MGDCLHFRAAEIVAEGADFSVDFRDEVVVPAMAGDGAGEGVRNVVWEILKGLVVETEIDGL